MPSIGLSDFRMANENRTIDEMASDIDFASRSNASVLITGETGWGKELIARLIHQRSGRAVAPFVTINCVGVPEHELESELCDRMGRGTSKIRPAKARDLEPAQSGTILLDEVAAIGPRLQGLLFTMLETVEPQLTNRKPAYRARDIRFMATTNPGLYARVVAGEFREDLYYRLNVIHLYVPLLRDRLTDVALLVDHFLGHTNDGPSDISPECDRAVPPPSGRI